MPALTVALGGALICVGLACGGGEALAPGPGETGNLQMVAGEPANGIEGRVIIRPVHSVERRGVTNQQPYQAKITVLDGAGREVAVVESDAEGRFRLPLPPGSYELRPESPGVYPRAAAQRVQVRRNNMTQVEIVYDSGRR